MIEFYDKNTGKRGINRIKKQPISGRCYRVVSRIEVMELLDKNWMLFISFDKFSQKNQSPRRILEMPYAAKNAESGYVTMLDYYYSIAKWIPIKLSGTIMNRGITACPALREGPYGLSSVSGIQW